MKKIRVLLAEDHAMVREGLKLLIDSQPGMEVIGEAENGQTAVELSQKLMPDIILMDVSMPDMNGLKATEKIRQECPSIKVLALTRHNDQGYLHEIMRAGAAGYVLKQNTAAELIRAMQAVATGGNYLDPAIAGKIIGRYLGGQTKSNADTQGDLSPREAEVLRLIAWGYSNKEIATRLDISIKTVEAHKANSSRKLGLQSRIDIVRFAFLQGWLEEN
jgi:two-component system, NarL family, response regulator NreC